MGSAESKPEGYSWKSSGPPSVSPSILESLQSSPESDASRARLMEKHVQARLGEELKKLSATHSDALELAHDRIAQAASSDSSPSDSDRPSRFTLGQEIAALQQTLEQRRTVRDMPPSVAAARAGVINCLRDKDRRPLECYAEVEAFKAEVKRMERDWVDRVTA